jgi:toxin ParE1/3/4
MRIRWTPAAVTDLQQISDYLSQNSPHYRVATMQRLYDGILALKRWPLRGRPGIESDTREMLFLPLPYIAVYRLKPETIEILRIYHTAQNRP